MGTTNITDTRAALSQPAASGTLPPLPADVKVSCREQNVWVDNFVSHVRRDLFLKALEMLERDDEKVAPRAAVLMKLTSVSQAVASPLSRIVRGLTVEYIRQTEEGLVPCNIENQHDPIAKEYWEHQSKAEFHQACFPGLFHAAASFNAIKNFALRFEEPPIDAISYHVLGLIMKTSSELFKKRFPNVDSSHDTRASIYNSTSELTLLAGSNSRRAANTRYL